MAARILVIEDNATNMALVVYLIEAFGYQPLSAFDGEQGFEMTLKELPDIVLCDVHLPKLDGYDVVKKIKNEPALQHIPVIAVTALAMVGDREKLLEVGFDGYIAKPIEPEYFVTQIEKFLPQSKCSTRLNKL
ncbi:MAG: response regulator [Pseudomonadota bacterium]